MSQSRFVHHTLMAKYFYNRQLILQLSEKARRYEKTMYATAVGILVYKDTFSFSHRAGFVYNNQEALISCGVLFACGYLRLRSQN